MLGRATLSPTGNGKHASACPGEALRDIGAAQSQEGSRAITCATSHVLQVTKRNRSTALPRALQRWFGHPSPLRNSPDIPVGFGCCVQERWWGKVGSSSVYRNYLKMANANPHGDLFPAIKLHIGQMVILTLHSFKLLECFQVISAADIGIGK